MVPNFSEVSQQWIESGIALFDLDLLCYVTLRSWSFSLVCDDLYHFYFVLGYHTWSHAHALVFTYTVSLKQHMNST